MAAAKKKAKEYIITMKLEKKGKNTNRFKVPAGTGEPPACDNVYLPQWACGDAKEIEVVIKIPQPQ